MYLKVKNQNNDIRILINHQAYGHNLDRGVRIRIISVCMQNATLSVIG